MENKEWTFIDIPATDIKNDDNIEPTIEEKVAGENKKSKKVHKLNRKKKSENREQKKPRNKLLIPLIIVSVIAAVGICLSVIQFISASGKDALIKEQQSTIDSQKNTITAKETMYNSLEKKYNSLQSDYNEIEDVYDFFYDYGACVNSGSRYYHHPDCIRFDSSSFWIYNTDAAEDDGYRPCPYCWH